MINLKEFKIKVLSKIKDSIDKGIETGLSMNSSGENAYRGTGEKSKKNIFAKEDDSHIVEPLDPTKPRYRDRTQKEKEKEIDKIKNNQASPIS